MMSTPKTICQNGPKKSETIALLAFRIPEMRGPITIPQSQNKVNNWFAIMW